MPEVYSFCYTIYRIWICSKMPGQLDHYEMSWTFYERR